MKSKINRLVDYREVPFEKKASLVCPPEHIEAQLNKAARRGKTYVAAACVAPRDVVTLDLESSLPRFDHKDMKLTAGSGLFDSEFEEALMGKKTGESFDFAKDGQKVKATVKDVQRPVYPEVTEEMVLAYAAGRDEYKGVGSMEEFRRRVIENYKEEKRKDAVAEAMQQVYEGVVFGSDFDFDEEEVAGIYSENLAQVKEQLKDEGMDWANLTPEQCEKNFGLKDRAEIEKALRDGAEEYIASALWLASVSGKDTAAIALEDDNDGWDVIEKFVRDSITFEEEKP